MSFRGSKSGRACSRDRNTHGRLGPPKRIRICWTLGRGIRTSVPSLGSVSLWRSKPRLRHSRNIHCNFLSCIAIFAVQGCGAFRTAYSSSFRSIGSWSSPASTADAIRDAGDHGSIGLHPFRFPKCRVPRFSLLLREVGFRGHLPRGILCSKRDSVREYLAGNAEAGASAFAGFSTPVSAGPTSRESNQICLTTLRRTARPPSHRRRSSACVLLGRVRNRPGRRASHPRRPCTNKRP
jgi:hypothetical protein